MDNRNIKPIAEVAELDERIFTLPTGPDLEQETEGHRKLR